MFSKARNTMIELEATVRVARNMMGLPTFITTKINK
jgi:hypothetical protein